jgi:hypothetical protein
MYIAMEGWEDRKAGGEKRESDGSYSMPGTAAGEILQLRKRKKEEPPLIL